MQSGMDNTAKTQDHLVMQIEMLEQQPWAATEELLLCCINFGNS